MSGGAGMVVVGGGQAAASLVCRLRSLGYDGAVTIVAEEPHPPYQRPPLSKKYLAGDMPLERLFLRPPGWYDDNRIAVKCGRRVVAIDRERRSVTLSDGSDLSYDRLALVTGSRARPLPDALVGGRSGVHLMRSIADADAMARELAPGRRVLVVGGGYIGLEAAAVAASRDLAVTLVETAPRILGRVACAETADYFRALHLSHGVDLREGVHVTGFEGAGRIETARLSDGSEIAVDFVIAGIGIVPNDCVAAEAGLATDDGILVDALCATTDPAIFAAGDCTRFRVGGALIRLESVQNAIDQAEAAAASMLDQGEPYRPRPWFWSDQYDVKLQIAGLGTGHDSVVVRPGRRPGAQSVLYYRGDSLIAIDAMNDPASYMCGKRIIEGGKDLPKDAAADPEANLKAYA